MKTNKTSVNIISALILSSGLTCMGIGDACAGPSDDYPMSRNPGARSRMGDHQGEQIDAAATLRKSTELYEAVVKGTYGKVPESVLAKTHCVAILPDVVTGALIVGGTHGVGVTSCRENNKWSSPAFVKLNAVSFGAQIGGKSSDIILFIVGERAMEALKRGAFSLGADAGVVAGTFDQNFETSTHGAIAYTRTEGVFAGASISGGQLTSDDVRTEAFYGKEVSYISLLEGRTATKQNDQVDQFTAILPR